MFQTCTFVVNIHFAVSSRNRSFTAPEIYSKHSKPIGSEGTLEKVSFTCVYAIYIYIYINGDWVTACMPCWVVVSDDLFSHLC